MNPAAAIQAALGLNNRQTAPLVGEREEHWSPLKAGKRSPKASTVQKWLDSLESNGIHVVLTWDSSGCVAVQR